MNPIVWPTLITAAVAGLLWSSRSKTVTVPPPSGTAPPGTVTPPPGGVVTPGDITMPTGPAPGRTPSPELEARIAALFDSKVQAETKPEVLIRQIDAVLSEIEGLPRNPRLNGQREGLIALRTQVSTRLQE